MSETYFSLRTNKSNEKLIHRKIKTIHLKMIVTNLKETLMNFKIIKIIQLQIISARDFKIRRI
jgi:hypothetical protein